MLEHEQMHKYYTIVSMCHMNNKCSSDQVTIVEPVNTIITNRATQASKPLILV